MDYFFNCIIVGLLVFISILEVYNTKDEPKPRVIIPLAVEKEWDI